MLAWPAPHPQSLIDPPSFRYNHTDPKRQELIKQYNPSGAHTYGTEPNRLEIMLSLASVQHFAPWVRPPASSRAGRKLQIGGACGRHTLHGACSVPRSAQPPTFPAFPPGPPPPPLTHTLQVRRVYIVVPPGQGGGLPLHLLAPPLRAKVRLVEESEFIPARFLPTFSSIVVESFLHAIPGIAEHFLYM